MPLNTLLVTAKPSSAQGQQRAKPIIFGPGADADITGQQPFPIAPAERDVIRKELLALTNALADAAGDDRAWWYNWVSTRDRINSPLLDWIAGCHGLTHALADGATAPTAVICPDWTTAALVKDVCRRNAWRSKIDIRSRARWTAIAALGALKRVKNMASMLRHGLAWRRRLSAAAREAFDKPWDIVMVTHFPSSLGGTTLPDYRDSYFGPLPGWLADQGLAVLVINCPSGNESAVCTAFENSGRLAGRAPTLGVLSRGEIIRGWLAAWRTPRNLTAPDQSRMLDTQAIAAALRQQRTSVVFGNWLETGLRRILANSPRAEVLHIYENNPWERACAFAADGRPVTGYLHCAINPGQPKYYDTPRSDKLRPKPNRVICTGPEAKSVLEDLYEPANTEILTGCALRETYDLETPARQEPPRRITRVLALLEGLPTAAMLLYWLEDAAGLFSEDTEFAVRGHPIDSPLPWLAKLAGVSLDGSGRLAASTYATLDDDLAAADVVVFKTSTTAYKALFSGIPIVWFDDGGVFPDDPLYRSTDLKRRARTPEDLKAACDTFSTLDTDTYRRELDAARRYILATFAAPTEESFRLFSPHATARAETAAAP